MKVVAKDNNLLELQRYNNGQVIHAYKVFHLDNRSKRDDDGICWTGAYDKTTGYSPMRDVKGRKTYPLAKGNTFKERGGDTNPHHECARGLHVCTLNWATTAWDRWCRTGKYLWLVEFTVADILAVPIKKHNLPSSELPPYYKNSMVATSTGKFRVSKFTLVRPVAWPKD